MNGDKLGRTYMFKQIKVNIIPNNCLIKIIIIIKKRKTNQKRRTILAKVLIQKTKSIRISFKKLRKKEQYYHKQANKDEQVDNQIIQYITHQAQKSNDNDDYNGQSQQDDEDNQQYNNNEDNDQQPQYNQYGGGEDDDENNNQNQRDNSGDFNNDGNEDNQNEFNNDYEDAKQNELGDDEDQQDSNNQRYSDTPISNKNLQNSNYRGSQFGAVSGLQESVNYRRNKDILDNFFKNYSGEVQNYFSEFKQKQIQDTQDYDANDNFYSQQNSGEVSIVASDVPLVLRISFYYDNITFHPTENDEEEYFNKPNSYKSIMDSLQKFFYQRKNIRDFDPNQTKVTYNDFVEFSYFFIQTDENLFLTQGGKEEQWVENQESPLERELKENIEKYENLLKKATSAQEKQIIQNTIDNLKAQLALLQNKGEKTKGGKNKAQITREQIRMRNLKEAFKFYSIQQNATGVIFTFERIIHEQNVINLACFLLFLKHFGILGKNKYVTKRELQNMFKKYALNYKELDLDHFKIMIEKVALAFYKEEEDLSNIDKVEKLYQLIEIDNIDKFRARFQLLNQPFRIQVKDGFRLLPFDQGRDIILKKVEPAVREKIKERKEMKQLQSISMFSPGDRENLKTLEGSKMPHSTQNRRHTDQQQQSQIYGQPGAPSYVHRKLKHQQGQISQAGKVTWQQLEQRSFSDMKNINNGQFKPTDLFNEEDDEEDKIYLAEYNLQDDRQRKMQESIMNKKGQENYGQLKDSVRPSLRYLQKQNPEYGKNGYSSSVGNLHRNVPEYYSPQSHLSPKQQAINQSYMQRAQQVEQDQRQREKALINQKIQRGINAANKRK